MPTVGSLGGNLFDTNKTTIDGSFQAEYQQGYLQQSINRRCNDWRFNCWVR